MILFIGIFVLVSGIIQLTKVENDEKVNILMTSLPEMSRNIDEPTGGLDDEVETEVVIGEDSTGTPVKLSATELPEDLPDIVLLSPIVCPHYTQYYHSYHRAVDLVNRNCNGSDWVVAVNKGTVTFVGWLGGYGQRVEIDHGDGFVTTYSHLSAVNTEVGAELSLGQKIGTLGSTGRSSGVHLHFEVIYNGVKIDPKPLLD